MINGLLRTTYFAHPAVPSMLADERIRFVSISAFRPDYAFWVGTTLQALVPEDDAERKLTLGRLSEREFEKAYRRQLDALGPEAVSKMLHVDFDNVLVLVAGGRREDGPQRRILTSWVNGKVGRNIMEEL